MNWLECPYPTPWRTNFPLVKPHSFAHSHDHEVMLAGWVDVILRLARGRNTRLEP